MSLFNSMEVRLLFVGLPASLPNIDITLNHYSVVSRNSSGQVRLRLLTID